MPNLVKEHIILTAKNLLLFGILLGVTILSPKVVTFDPWVSLFFGYISCVATYLIYKDYASYKEHKRNSEKK